MKHVLALTIAALLLALLPSPAAAQPSASIPVFPPGLNYGRLARAGEASIPYGISIPAGYESSTPVPLVLSLHFGGNPAGAGYGMLKILVHPALEQLGAIIIAPDTVGGRWDTPDNERAVNLLLDEVINTYNIDKKKIAVTGFSMGGAGVWHFAGKYPERFSAAIPISGRPSPSTEGWRVPVLAIHSIHDTVVPIGPAEARIAELRAAGARARMIVLSGPGHHQTSLFVEGLRQAVPWLKEIWK